MAEIIRLDLFTGIAVLPLATRGPGTVEQKLALGGNSILSTLYVSAIDPATTVSVSYHDYGVGEDAGEDLTIGSHSTQSVVGSQRRVFAPFHIGPRIKATVTGGNATFGVFASALQQIASDLTLMREGQVADFANDSGLGIMVYDEATGLFNFLRGEGGAIAVTPMETGTPRVLVGESITTPGVEQVAVTATVPVGKRWHVRTAHLNCRGTGQLTIYVDSLPIAFGSTGAGESNVKFPDGTWAPHYVATAGEVVEIKYTQTHGPLARDLRAVIGLTEIDV
jgi:hypothetical protein